MTPLHSSSGDRTRPCIQKQVSKHRKEKLRISPAPTLCQRPSGWFVPLGLLLCGFEAVFSSPAHSSSLCSNSGAAAQPLFRSRLCRRGVSGVSLMSVPAPARGLLVRAAVWGGNICQSPLECLCVIFTFTKRSELNILFARLCVLVWWFLQDDFWKGKLRVIMNI